MLIVVAIECGGGTVRACRGVNDDVVTNAVRSSCLSQERKVVVLGRCSVRVGCCVFQVFVFMTRSTGIVRAYGVVNDAVAIEYTS